MGRVSLFLAAAIALGACGGPPKPPVRGVIESDVEGWTFRRYQSVLDVEVWVPKNKAVAHTASYAQKSAEKAGSLSEKDVVSVFVTRYEKKAGVTRGLVHWVRRLSQERGYAVEEKRIEGVRLFELVGAGEYWVAWAAKRHIVKIGGPGRESAPGDLVEAYSDRYPSKLRSGDLEDAFLDEPDEAEVQEEPFDADNPRPEWK
jgi:hypothetical protein